jgi:hypothetical protein
MANTITRKLREYHAVSYRIDKEEGGDPELVPEYEIDYLATTADERTARREFKAAGYPVKNGTPIDITPGVLHMYTATIDAFLSVATDRIIEE